MDVHITMSTPISTPIYGSAFTEGTNSHIPLPGLSEPEVLKPKVPMVEANSETIDLLEDCVRISIGGSSKFISYSNFVEVLKARVVRDEVSDSGVKGFCLPKNCVWVGKSSDTIEINFYYPECVREILYGNSSPQKLRVTVPNIIIYHKLRKHGSNDYEVELSKFFCTDLSEKFLSKEKIHRLDPNSRIFLLPFSNTYDEGNMCYGSNSLPRKLAENNLKPLNGYYEFLFNSPFNDDLGIKAIRERMYVSDWYRLLVAEAAAGRPFPYSRLNGWTAASGALADAVTQSEEAETAAEAEADVDF